MPSQADVSKAPYTCPTFNFTLFVVRFVSWPTKYKA